ncbi:MAG: response regulator transcription factor [Opitutales bacterium]|jgi:DNA-binding NarL/FixJ family response regulator|tara:strand:- start:3756 stop:4418 length:663 start_codon:yes stop_codon:yes gene_type:complete
MNPARKAALSIALLDQHCILRDGLESLFGGIEELAVVASVSRPKELSKCFNVLQLDVVVMGLIFDGHDALRHITDWSESHPETKFLVLSQLPEMTCARRVLDAGGNGYLMKGSSPSALVDGVHRVAAGGVVVSAAIADQLLKDFSKRTTRDEMNCFDQLTALELYVLSLIGQGHATAAIATKMDISKEAVSTCKERLKTKLSITCSQQLMQIALQRLGRL